jgi:uncharacterized membrane protein YhaH (DUF805 family)
MPYTPASPNDRTGSHDAGWSSPVARQAHNLKVTGSNPVPATITKARQPRWRAFLMPAQQNRPVGGSSLYPCLPITIRRGLPAAHIGPGIERGIRMTFKQSIASGYSKYVTFSGRASRSEYWFFVLFSVLVAVACATVDIALGLNFALFYGPFYALFALVNLLPSISVLVRRLHDTGRSGWWYWIALVPIVGFIVLIVWLCTRGTQGENRFGSDPLFGEAEAF